ncbi:MAG: 30S ribosome-binding factor RbfA [Lentisphaerae bacterium]|nr:30S ribosome-binding factor RbfA [Lentisphaerota bacterium]
MTSDRITRVNALLRREIGEALFRVLHESGVDLGAITVTRVQTARNLREARVWVSIRNHEDERLHMLGLLKKHRAEIQARINRDMSIKYTPRLRFELDHSIEQGDRVLHILDELDQGGASGGEAAS